MRLEHISQNSSVAQNSIKEEVGNIKRYNFRFFGGFELEGVRLDADMQSELDSAKNRLVRAYRSDDQAEKLALERFLEDGKEALTEHSFNIQNFIDALENGSIDNSALLAC